MLLKDFITDKVPPSEFYQYQFENGLTGIEWFLQEQGHRLDEQMKEMAETWATLQPKLVQAVEERNEEGV